MKRNKGWGLTLALLMLIATSLSAESERENFNKGIRAALSVLQHEKNNSLIDTQSTMKGKYCVSLKQEDGEVLEPFNVVKMESLSLMLEYKPAYLQYYKDGESKNILCFAMGDTLKEAEAKLVAIQARYERIELFYPEVIILGERTVYKRIIPYLGKWSRDMSGTIEILNSEINTLRNKSRAMGGRLKKVRRYLDKLSSALGDGSSVPSIDGRKNKINKIKSDITPVITKKTTKKKIQKKETSHTKKTKKQKKHSSKKTTKNQVKKKAAIKQSRGKDIKHISKRIYTVGG